MAIEAAKPPQLAEHSRMVQRIRRRYAQELDLLPEGLPSPTSMQLCLRALAKQKHPLPVRLRILRQLVLERLAVLDCDHGASLETVTHAMTHLAELCLQQAWQHARQQLHKKFGRPLTHSGTEAQLWIVGMGKLGARELNVSSDIDLIYVYDEDGQSTGGADGQGKISVQDYFARAVRLIYNLLGEVTEHGFVFRIDLALRPNGQSGAPLCSLQSLQQYMQNSGREWERFAWMKSRVVAPQASIKNASADALRSVVTPFVFRKYLDYNVFESLRVLHQQIRDHAGRRSAGRPARSNDIKLSRGGIREVEFIVQLLQVARGGQYPELRTRTTIKALRRVARARLMPQHTSVDLNRAYIFLRRVEHRIQYLDDLQTHVLPTNEADLLWLAQTMHCEDTPAFLDKLAAHRERIAREFDRLLSDGQPGFGQAGSEDDDDKETLANLAHIAALTDNHFLRRQLDSWWHHQAIDTLNERTLECLLELLTRSVEWFNGNQASETGVLRFLDWLESMLNRPHYLILLLEQPAAHKRMLRVLGTFRWPAHYLTRHPDVIDELGSTSLMTHRFDPAALEQELQERRQALSRGGEDVEDNLLSLLRHAHHAATFRTLVRDIEGRISVEQVADDLSALADAILRVALDWCWQLLPRRHRKRPQLAIIAYGKLGGKELGYGSDLDLVFVFEDTHRQAQEIYTELARKLIAWLTAFTGDGDLYDIDTALRPNGPQGLLVTSFKTFVNYQMQDSRNSAWTWEHQAMTRARMIAPEVSAAQGLLALQSMAQRDPESVVGNVLQANARTPVFDLTTRFDRLRHDILTLPRNKAQLRRGVVDMRRKIMLAHPVRGGMFDVKHSPGGMLDAEFATQYLVLAYTASHPELEPNLGNIAILARAEAAGLLPTGVGQAAGNAYRSLRRIQHHARLDEQSTQVPPEDVQDEREAVNALWQAVFETGSD